MLRFARWSSLLVLSACTAAAPPVRSPSSPRAPRLSRCALGEAGLACRWSEGGATVLVADDATAFALRLGGGAFVLRAGGVLERYDREGRCTGRTPTAYESLLAAGPYACGVADGAVACFRDGHEDLICPDAGFEPRPEPVGVPPAARAVGDGRRALLDAGGELYRLGGSCRQHCIRLGCEGPVRCMDRCGPGRRPRLRAERIGEPAERQMSAETGGGEVFFKTGTR